MVGSGDIGLSVGRERWEGSPSTAGTRRQRDRQGGIVTSQRTRLSLGAGGLPRLNPNPVAQSSEV